MRTEKFLGFISQHIHDEYRGYRSDSKLRARSTYRQGADVRCLFMGSLAEVRGSDGALKEVVINGQRSRWEAVLLSAYPVGSSLIRYHLYTTTADAESGSVSMSATLPHPDEPFAFNNPLGQKVMIRPQGQVEVSMGGLVFSRGLDVAGTDWLKPV